jgi:hypothetical protein
LKGRIIEREEQRGDREIKNNMAVFLLGMTRNSLSIPSNDS